MRKAKGTRFKKLKAQIRKLKVQAKGTRLKYQKKLKGQDSKAKGTRFKS